MKDLKSHWENIYSTKEFEETSWFQEKPETSLKIIQSLGLSKKAQIIDIGGGNSFLVDHLLKLGYKNISVLDISEMALEKAKERLGEKSEQVNWICSDVTEYNFEQEFELWHDRAAFHFLTEDSQVENYISRLKTSLRSGGYFILGTFSENGPDKCSGIEIRKYSSMDLQELFEKDFEIVRLENLDHKTPWDAVQNFTFGLFRKK
ncbi:class I SAM-dependent methyltransferase [Christiangramia sediminis]|uniref:Class I SAM-dependent methyltransferase n=1 Tax=Christiangramia sediminis TaxID=2881336 RepID=A0A9X1LGH2_9FLAO|nr:class I SAM-dependent methyltransferase [Christiangramia sediminis]MCB7479862.1 class I SAM-dependent methyltransferase [Christiangramia sediminis]